MLEYPACWMALIRTGCKHPAAYARKILFTVSFTSSPDTALPSTVRPGAIKVGRAPLQRSPMAQLMVLRSKGSFAPVEKTIRSQIGAMHVVATALNGTAIEPFGSLIREVVTVGVTKFPNVRWRSDVDRTLVNENAFRQRQLVSKASRVSLPPSTNRHIRSSFTGQKLRRWWRCL